MLGLATSESLAWMRSPRLLAVSLLVAASAEAQTSAPVPPALQAATFAKIFTFDRALGDRARLAVMLVHPSEGSGENAAAALQQAFAAVAIDAKPATHAEAARRLQAPAAGLVVYLLPGVATPELLGAAAAARALTIAGEAALAEQGKVSVGLSQRGDKADIVVNLDRMALEGHDFSAQLLKFARVVRGGTAGPGTASAAAGGAAGPPLAPVLIGLTKPEYPTQALRFRLEGEVVMRLSVDESGKVTAVELIKGVGRGGLDEAALAAARSARFRPPKRNGTPVASTYVLTMPFRL
jgi:TonB family protein